MNIATFRYDLYRLSKRIALGSLGGSALGTNVCRSLEEGRSNPIVEAHIAVCRKIADACVQTYEFPKDFPPEFPREAAFDAKCVYRLRNVVVSPESGLVWFPDGPILQESAGSLPRLFDRRITATLRHTSALEETGPVIAFPSFGYYHILFDALANVLHALELVPDAKLLLPRRHHVFMDGILDFLGVATEKRILANSPVVVQDYIFSPTWVNGGFIPPVDLASLRNAILPKIGENRDGPRKIYISRLHSRNRPLVNENQIESFLKERGFSVLYFETLPFAEQMRLVAGANTIVAPHGAGLANLVAASPKTRIIEFLSRNWFNTCYAKLAVQLGCRYSFVESRNKTSQNKRNTISPAISTADLSAALKDYV